MPGLEGEIHVPGIGGVEKKYVLGGVLVGAGIGVIVYIRSRNKANQANAASTSASTGSVVTDPAGNTCSVLDPNSGYCPGSPEDVAYQESLSGSYSGLGYNGGQYSGTGVSDAGLPPATGGGGATGGTTGTTGGAVTNTDWINEALGVIPGDTATIQTALASVLGGLTVTTAQKNIFNEAVGILGPPPGGYPQPIKTSDTAGHPGGGTKTAGAISNLQASGESATGFTVHWNPAQGATGGYHWVAEGGGITKSGSTKSTSASVSGLKPKTSYNFGIQALPGGPGNNIHVSTK